MEKIRIFALARDLDMESKDLLTMCKQHGIDVKNQLSTVEPEVRDQIVALVKKPAAKPQTQAAPSLGAPVKPIINLDNRPPVLRPGRTPAEAPAKPAAPVEPASVAPEPVKKPTPPTPPVAPAQPSEPAALRPPEPIRPKEAAPRPAEKPAEPPVRGAAPPPVQPPTPPAAPPRPVEPARGAGTPPAQTPPPAEPEPPRPPTTVPMPTSVPNLGGGGVRNLGPRPGGPSGGGDGNRPRRPTPGTRQGGGRTPGQLTPHPTPSLRPQPQDKKPAPVAGPKKLADIPTNLQGDHSTILDQIFKGQTPGRGTGTPGVPGAPVEIEEEEEGGAKGKGKRRAPGEVIGRDARRNERNERQQRRKAQGEGEIKVGRGAVALIEEDDTPRRGLRHQRRQKRTPGTQPRKGKVPIELPITVRSLSEAISVRSGELLLKLMGQGLPPTININSSLDPDVAEALALDYGCELDVKRPQDDEEDLLAEYQAPDAPEDLVPRAPVVTIMGHVDHGKTSLLDKIRVSNVAATEAGGITQVIRAWRVDHGGRPVTFLDTPGHEAFTKMRARGANVTDIAVIVVAADDGVMPQTEEAVSHAKAAGVSIVVAINKVDLPNANIRKTEQQLYNLGLIPDTMGGDVPFVQTSAATGKGIDQLLDMLSVVAELKELKANPNRTARGTCLETHLSEGEGVRATLLVQNGTLHRGDVILCGASYGRVRAMYGDHGQQLDSAGPSVPVWITGLDEAPNADDPFLVVPDLAMARAIAEERKARQQEAALVKRAPVTLETLKEAHVTELKVILKAEARGSIEAIRKELEKLYHEEVRVRVLHTGIGGITESDVQLALTSPQDTLILGFNVVPDERARALAEERGVQMRQYNIIYQLTDDIRSALEGKLKPREEVIHLGRAVVREVFKISRVGTIAGCHVTQGVIERSARVRVIRNGVVIYPPADRTVGLESLKRFKEDAREVREGYECGMKIAGYDDIKVDDVIEAYRIEQVQRTLS